jgi:predicted O-methyltransferase YrrM
MRATTNELAVCNTRTAPLLATDDKAPRDAERAISASVSGASLEDIDDACRRRGTLRSPWLRGRPVAVGGLNGPARATPARALKISLMARRRLHARAEHTDAQDRNGRDGKRDVVASRKHQNNTNNTNNTDRLQSLDSTEPGQMTGSPQTPSHPDRLTSASGPTAAEQSSLANAMRPPDNRVDHGWRNRSVFGLIGLRPPSSEHTVAEASLLRQYASGARVIVEVGVAEGGSAWEMRKVMAADGTLYLIDPYHLSRFGYFGPAGLIARRLVASARRGTVKWITEFSPLPAVGWATPIDFLFLDGDHSREAVKADWAAWTAHLVPGGQVALHDARLEAGWTKPDDGPVMLVAELRNSPDWTIVAEVDSLVVLTRAS